MKCINWLWTDDVTGRHSDTALRAWLTFGPFLGTICILLFAILTRERIDPSWLQAVSTVLQYTGPAAGGGAIAYGVQRYINTRSVYQQSGQEDVPVPNETEAANGVIQK